MNDFALKVRVLAQVLLVLIPAAAQADSISLDRFEGSYTAQNCTSNSADWNIPSGTVVKFIKGADFSVLAMDSDPLLALIPAVGKTSESEPAFLLDGYCHVERSETSIEGLTLKATFNGGFAQASDCSAVPDSSPLTFGPGTNPTGRITIKSTDTLVASDSRATQVQYTRDSSVDDDRGEKTNVHLSCQLIRQ